MTPFTVRGVPRSLHRDAWWMAADATTGIGSNPPKQVERVGLAPRVALILLIGLGDLLLWQVFPGISLPLFLISVAVAAHALFFQAAPFKSACRAWAFLLIALIPSVDLVQPLSVAFALVGMLGFVGITTGHGGNAATWAAVRFPMIGAFMTMFDAQTLAKQPRSHGTRSMLASLKDWIVPGVLGLIFGCLLIVANPVIDRWATDFFTGRSLLLPDPEQLIFWIFLVPLIWPFLRLNRMTGQLLKPTMDLKPFGQVWFLTGRSVTRALIIFNLLFVIQTLTDLAIFSGEAALPHGMTYAQYAHRGAYPLLFAALLAGAFALLTQPFMVGRPVLRMLLLLWVAQTAVLVASSMVRLDLYIDAYNLTRMRFAAFIWMAVIGGGLILMLCQILRGFGPSWLMMRATELAIITLYVCSLINIDGFVARHNLNAQDREKDIKYICTLGEGAIPAIAAYNAQVPWQLCAMASVSAPQLSYPNGWREWGYRNARLRSKLAQIEGATQ